MQASWQCPCQCPEPFIWLHLFTLSFAILGFRYVDSVMFLHYKFLRICTEHVFEYQDMYVCYFSALLVKVAIQHKFAGVSHLFHNTVRLQLWLSRIVWPFKISILFIMWLDLWVGLGLKNNKCVLLLPWLQFYRASWILREWSHRFCWDFYKTSCTTTSTRY